jgi:hypothetical protein
VDLWELEGRELAAHARLSPQRQLYSISESVVAVCVLYESEDQTVQVKELSLSALSADSGLNVVTADVAAAAHPGATPPASKHSLRSLYPSVADPECLALKELSPTTSPVESSSSSAQLSPYPSSCRLPSVKEMIENYRMAR